MTKLFLSRSEATGTAVECFPVFIFVLIAIAFAVIASNLQSRATALNAAYSRLAQHYGGFVRPAGWFDCPSATFTVNGIVVSVSVFASGDRRAKYYSQVHLEWPDPTLRVEISPRSFWGRVGWVIGVRDIEIGSPQFDDDYVILGGDPQAVRNLLTFAVQHQINLLRRFLGNGEVYVSFSGGRILVKKQAILRDFESLRRLVEMSLELHAQALLTQSAGIEFDDDAVAQPVESPVCQVCGDVIEANMVVCRRCQTPHHLDCWQYFGRCSTYGCGETRSHAPRMAAPLPGQTTPQAPDGS